MTTPTFHPHWGQEVHLGKAPKKDDPRTLKLASYTSSALPAPPKSIQWGQSVPSFPMYANDSLGDCTCAAAGHMIQTWTSANKALWTPTEKEITSLYWATGTQDTGRVELDVLNYWRNTGIGVKADKIAAYVEVNPLNVEQVKQAIWLFGGLYIGIQLPLSAQQQSYWKVVRGQDSDPGSWGGHAVNVIAYTSTYLTVVTWGARLKMSWGFWKKYVDEAYAVLSPDWATATAPSGFNFAALQSDLTAL